MGIFRSSKLFANFRNNLGFTLIELMIVISIIGTLAAIATPNYLNFREKAIIGRCTAEIRLVEKELLVFFIEWGTFPANLRGIGLGNLRDPWGNPYQYLPVAGSRIGQLRKDRFLVPVNTDFDLYSMGPDGRSRMPFNARDSRDDIVRANNGQYVGPVSGY